jgi:hypothetical protein
LNGCRRREGHHRWIPVGERLPDQRRSAVLVFCAGRANTYTAYLDEPDSISELDLNASPWRHFGGDGGYCHGVTHWMPLPEARNDRETSTENEQK